MSRRRSTLAVATALSLSLVSIGSRASGATTSENLAKYTRLKQRLAKEFMVVGTGPGNSIPATERSDGEGFIKWADATINQGWYIGVLASEYHLRTNVALYPGADGGNPTAKDATLEELYQALFAMERLDKVADQSFPPPCSSAPALNGFFLRDDVPASMLSSFAPLTRLESDFVDPTLTNKEMSQDQVYHVLLGLSLVKRLVPASVVAHGKPIRAWAMEQAQRIGGLFAKDSWLVKNPACGNRTVARGGQAIGYSGGTRLALGFLTDGALLPSTPVDVWGTLKSPSNPAYNDSDNLHMALAIAAVGNGWGATTADDLATLSKAPDWPLYPILHRVLHDADAKAFCTTTGAAINTRAREMIDELPATGEPVNPLPGPPLAHGFTSCNRFIRPKAQHYVGQPGGNGRRYSGTDFLLLHNLYAIATPATWTKGAGVAPCSVPEGAGPGTSSGTSSGGPAGGGDPGANGGSSGDPTGSGASSDGDANAGDAGCACRTIASRADSNPTPFVLGLVAAFVIASVRRSRRRQVELELLRLHEHDR